MAALPVLERLTSDERKTLQELAILFMYEKEIIGAQGLVITQHMTMVISLQASLPVLYLGLDCYEGWVSVIVYPSGFAPERTVTDEYGVVHHVQMNQAGEAWQRGPVILAWDEAASAAQIDGDNLVIHEFVHKLDMQNGEANGYPPIHKDMQHSHWVQAFSSGYEDFRKRCQQGVSIGINCYGAESPAEFFAVFSEVFFERPEILVRYYADIYEQMKKYYQQDPVQGMSG